MKKQNRRVRAGLLPAFVLLLALTHCNDNFKVSLISYNAGNLFDDRVDGTEYSPYGDGPSGGWSSARFEAKLAAIARVIKNAFPGGPDIVALQEVENLNTLNQLCERHLADLQYTYRIIYPVDGSAHQCALLSRYPVKRTGALLPGDWQGQPLRAILEAEIDIHGETLYVFNNHWKAKSGGERVTEPGRLKSAEQLIARLKSVFQTSPQADIVILGDFNENLDEFTEVKGKYQTAFIPAAAEFPLTDPISSDSLSRSTLLLTASPDVTACSNLPALCLYDPWYETADQNRGSYVFRGRWLTPDHILLACGLFDDTAFRYQPGQFNVMRAEFLLDPQTGYPLKENQRSYRFSDHLPLLLTLSLTVR